MKYLLDTNIISVFARKGSLKLEQQLNLVSPGTLAISSLTVLEIEYGLRIHEGAEKRIGKTLRDFMSVMTQLPFDSHCAVIAADIKAKLKKAGTPIGAFDILIGATALSHDLVLVTHNIAEFQRIKELMVENWI